MSPEHAASYAVTITPVGGFAATVALSVTGLPPGASATTSRSYVGGAQTVTLVIRTSAKTPPGRYTLTVTGRSGKLRHATTVILVVPRR